MDTYLNDFEQAEQVKNWIKQYAPSIVVGILLALAILYGMQYWTKNKATHVEQASIAYTQVLNLYEQNDAEQMNLQATKLIADFPDSPYASLTNFFLAQQKVQKQELEKAKQHLMWVVENSKIAALRATARIRAARVLAEQGSHQAALQLLSVIDDPSYQVLADEIKGDILLATGDKLAAKKAYQQAVADEDAQNLAQRSLLKMKLDNLQQISMGDPA